MSSRSCTRIVAHLFPLVLIVAQLACGTPAEEWQLRGWTVTPPRATISPTATEPTQTPFVVVVSATIEPTEPATILCVVAQEAVHLRPSASTDNYPIVALKNMDKVIDLGGRDGKWWFVQVNDKQGWIHSDYIGECK